jgi:hypothetical protein
MDSGGIPIPRSQVSVGVEADLRAHLGTLAKGRVIVVDYFATRRCSVTLGDLTVDFRGTPPTGGQVELAAVEGVRLFADRRLLPLLRDAGPTLRRAGRLSWRQLVLRLDRPEAWLELLEQPGMLAGKRAFPGRGSR